MPEGGSKRMIRILQACTEISGPGSDWCPGVTPPDILAATGGDWTFPAIVAVAAFCLVGAGMSLKRLVDRRRP